MPVRYSQPTRRPHFSPYGSATLALFRRVGAGSTITSDEIDTSTDQIKTLGVRGDQRGSFFIQTALVGTQHFATIFEGTFPASRGSIKTVSFEEASRRMRVQVRYSSAGSATVFYGGFSPRF